MIFLKSLSLLICLVLLINIVRAQQSSTRTEPSESSNEHRGLLVGVDYASQVIFWGRDFEERQFGVSPYLMFETGKGFYAYALNDYWSKTPHKPARNIVGMGYEGEVADWLTVFTGYERWINHYGDSYLNNSLKNEFEAGLRFTAKKITVEPVFYYMWGLEKIYQLDVLFERNHDLLKFKNGKITFTPAMLLTFATPVFSYIYYETPEENYDYEKFRFVDGEASFTLTLELGNIELTGAGLLNVPVSVGNENLTPFFYYTFGMSYKFEF